MVVEVHPVDVVMRLLLLIEQEHLSIRNDQYWGNDSDMLCDVVTNLLRAHLLDGELSPRCLSLVADKRIVRELGLIQAIIAKRTGIFEDQFPELIHDIIISPRIIGVIVIIKE